MFGSLDRIIGIAGLTLALVGIVVSTWVAYDVYDRSKPKEPALSIQELSRFDLKSNTEYIGMQLDYYLDGKRADYVVSSLVDIVNSGGTPIVPDDFFSKLTVSPTSPLKMVGVTVVSTIPEDLVVRLSQGQDEDIIIEPVLLNPGDRIRLGILLDARNAEDLDIDNATVLNWSARIRNIPKLIAEPFKAPEIFCSAYNPGPSIYEQFTQGFHIVLAAKSVPVFVALIFLLSFLAFFLMKRKGLIRGISFLTAGVLITMFLFSVSTSEIIVYYIFGNPLTQTGAHHVNGALVLFHAFALLGLALFPRRS